MNQSLFFQERTSDFPPFSLLLFEGLDRASHDAGVDVDEHNVVQLLADALKYLKYPDYSMEAAAGYALRMSEMLEAETAQLKEVESTVKKSTAGSAKKRQFGQAFIEWAQTLASDQICLYLTDYDTNRARFLYCEEDRALVMQAFHLKLSRDWHTIEAQLEAVVYGMGGGAEEPNVEVLDINSEDPAESDQAMSELAAAFGGRG